MRIQIFVLLFLAVLVGVHGQSTLATITGAVTDPSGAMLPGVEVKAVHKTLGLEFVTLSNDAGVFTLPEVREGEYVVSARMTGFKEFVADNIVLGARAMRRLDIRLELGEVRQRVEVVAEAGAIETERAVISSGRTDRELHTLPISANSLYYMFMTLPMTQPRGSSPSFAGTRNDQYGISVDGGSINSGTGGVISNLAGQTETFKEMKVEMVNNTAEHSALGQVLLLTKSGDNDFHGSAFYNYQSPSLRARDFFASERGDGIDHEFGFGLGGPFHLPNIYNGKNRTFWYLNLDTQTASQLREELQPNVPLEAWRNGDFSALGVQIRNPFTGEVYKDGKIPSQHINPVSQKIQERFYPLPNVGDVTKFSSRNYLEVKRGKAHREWHGNLKLDHTFTESDATFASYQLHQVDVNDWETSLPAFGWKYWKRQSKVVGAGWTHTFNPSMLNQLRFSHAFNGYPRRGPLEGREVVEYLGLQGLHPDLPAGGGVFKVAFSGLSLTPISQTDTLRPGYVNKNTNIHNDFSYFRGRHNIKAGVQVGMVGFENQTLGASTFGDVEFANTFTKVPGVSKSGHPYADFLFGIPTGMRRGQPEWLEDRKRTVLDLYVQDEWKVTNQLTFSGGVRYEYHAPWHAADGLLSMFDPVGGRIIVADEGLGSVSTFLPEGYVDIVSASSAGFPAKTLVFADKKKFGPRLGFAYRPFSGGQTVIRGGYGIFYDMTPESPTAASTPFIRAEPTYTNPSTPTVVLPRVFPETGSGKMNTVSIPSAINPHLRFPYTQQWNFTIEHERWGAGFRASYVGTAARQMFWRRNINAPIPDGRLFVEKTRPFPNYPAITYTDNGANHTYNALSLEATRKLSSGVQFQAAYTWARDIGDDVTPLNPFDRRMERGPDEIVPNQRFTGMVLYEFPFGRGKRFFNDCSRPLDIILSNWEFSLITYQQTGRHLTPVVRMPDPTGTVWTNSANRPTVTIRPDLVGDPYLDEPSRERWFDPSAFTTPPVGRYGAVGRGIITGPGGNVFHAALHKSIRIVENVKFRLGLVATNVFNHTNFGAPAVDVSRSTAGEITSTGGPNGSNPGDRAGARNMFLRMHLEW